MVYQTEAHRRPMATEEKYPSGTQALVRRGGPAAMKNKFEEASTMMPAGEPTPIHHKRQRSRF
eukprot:CAMPEP_0174898618 /NCGR_PEP_ID=MMETSP0167-20121228/22736_1 /TAXON_ID=38298 /ORGANISM="Rhodella maculata, Strain CCMP736" /LENGTH=62 /DNA_ID=CAMNT_0016139309 /DNA_START=52 /DNA_END=240 /DNA_ORIENTATION=+